VARPRPGRRRRAAGRPGGRRGDRLGCRATYLPSCSRWPWWSAGSRAIAARRGAWTITPTAVPCDVGAAAGVRLGGALGNPSGDRRGEEEAQRAPGRRLLGARDLPQRALTAATVVLEQWPLLPILAPLPQARPRLAVVDLDAQRLPDKIISLLLMAPDHMMIMAIITRDLALLGGPPMRHGCLCWPWAVQHPEQQLQCNHGTRSTFEVRCQDAEHGVQRRRRAGVT